MPQLSSGGGDDLGANDEMIAFKDEGEQEEKIQENAFTERDLADLKSSLVNESEINQSPNSAAVRRGQQGEQRGYQEKHREHHDGVSKHQDGGMYKTQAYPGYPFLMLPDPYLSNGSISPSSNKVSVVQQSHGMHPLTSLLPYSNEHFSPSPPHLPTDMSQKTGMTAHSQSKTCRGKGERLHSGFDEGEEVKSICTAGVSSLTSLYSDQEETDTKMVLHAIHLAESYSRIIVRSDDTDVEMTDWESIHRHQSQDLSGYYSLPPGGVGQISPSMGWTCCVSQDVSQELSPGISESLPRRRPLLLGFMHRCLLLEPEEGCSGEKEEVFPHSLMLGPSGMHPTGIPHPAIVPPSGKQEHDHYDRSMYMKPQVEAKREKEPKKPVIKKPLNAFMLYMKEMRAKVIAECTLKESAAINQILGRRWHALTREEQAKYYELARKERQLHMQLYPTWSARDNYEAGLSGVAGEKSKADWGKKKRRKREKLQDSNTDPGSPKKCRARFGLNQQTDWCGPCRAPPPSDGGSYSNISQRRSFPRASAGFTVGEGSFSAESGSAARSVFPAVTRKKKCIRYLQGGGCPSPTSSDLSAIDSPPSLSPSPTRHRLYQQHQLPPSPGCSPPPPPPGSPSTHLPLSPPTHTRSHTRLPPPQTASKRGDPRQPKHSYTHTSTHTYTHLDLSGRPSHGDTATLSVAKAAGLSLKVLTESQ
ncbi:hypothetical protein JOQ06_019162 [Pogonophryne albipinna]|uniref:HMG box domain-containing protein n=1 Tax=Pogonophryne albipinna TaxID=1090488 RepID=A0AAD6FCQ8_9TELE|nr:hypothetical protein JOQ06_019162 [Pogonophryne albipinna]